MTIALGVLCAAGLFAIAASGRLSRLHPLRRARRRRAERDAPRTSLLSRIRAALRVGRLWPSQIATATLGALAGWQATGLAGFSVLLGGLGVLLPPFMAAPSRRRRETRIALAWSVWARQLAELARAGLGLPAAVSASVPHAPVEIARKVADLAATATTHGLGPALRDLAAKGPVWEPEIAAGLQMAATSGGSVAEPLLDLCGRIDDAVEMHRTRTEAVVSLWAQTIALLSLAGGVVVLMYRNNPAYFEPYRVATGRTVLIGIACVLLVSTSVLVFNSVVRIKNSVLIAPKGRRRTPTPI